MRVAGNKVGVTGVEAFLISIQRQAEVSSSAGKPTGLMRFSLSVSNAMKHPSSKSKSKYVMIVSKVSIAPYPA